MKNYVVAGLVVVSAGIVLIFGNPFSRSQELVAGGGGDALSQPRAEGVVRAPGTLEFSHVATIRCELMGGSTIVSIVPPGSRVKKGEIVVEFDDSRIRKAVEAQKLKAGAVLAVVEHAKANLERVQSSQAVQLAEARNEVELAELAYERAVGDGGDVKLQIRAAEREVALLEKKSNLIEKRRAQLVGAEDVALQYELSLLDLEVQRTNAREKLEHLKSRVLPFEVAKHKNAKNVAVLRQQTIKLDAETETARAAAEVEAKREAVENEHGRLAELKRQLAGCRVAAPQDGAIVYASGARRGAPVKIEQGAAVRELQTVLSIVDPQQVEVQIRVHATEIARVKKGLKASVRFDAIPNRSYAGAVESVSDALNADFNAYVVVVRVEKPDEFLKAGMTGDVEIDAAE